jgi:hypothetical protein
VIGRRIQARRWQLLLGALAAVAAAGVAACGAAHPMPAASSPTSPSATPVTGPPPLPLPGSSVPARPAVAGCPASAVTAPDAPFCYPLPDGFTDHSTELDYAYGWQWRTLVSLGPHDLIEVIGQPVQADLDKLSEAQALSYAQQLELQVNALGVLHASALVPTYVDGARGYLQVAQYAGGITVQNVNVLRGDNVIEISCQHTTAHAEAVTRACSTVLADLKLANA